VISVALAVAGWLGIGAVVLGGLALDESLAYPGLWALIPTLGAAAIIAGGDRVGGPGVLLGLAPIRFLGRISYSLYLWHWPLLVLPAVALGGRLSPQGTVVLVAIAIGVASASTLLDE
jgi:peptidoglycan/LPS O-acetylase OafA/YrhL